MKQKQRKTSNSLSKTWLPPLKSEVKVKLKSKLSDSTICHTPKVKILTLTEAIPQHLKSDEIHSIVHNSLNIHDINKEYRAKMIDWMIEVTTTFKCDTETFFLSVKLMDKFMKKLPNSLDLSKLHCLGVTCMFIASKMQDVKPLMLEIIVKKIAHNQLTKTEIRETEKLILNTLDFNINLVTVYDILMNLSVLVPEQILCRSDIVCRLCQYYIEYSEVRPTSLAYCSLLLACKESAQNELAERLLESSGNSQLEQMLKNVETDIANFKQKFPLLRNIQKFCLGKLESKQEEKKRRIKL